jgi:N-hydroxyarylamine O-acetyltransferase
MCSVRSASHDDGAHVFTGAEQSMNLAGYLTRIDYRGALEPTTKVLRAVHAAHLLHVPFENLDIQRRRLFTLDPEALFDKIVTRRRGGFCYELNGLFALLLEQLGFQVTRLAARVMNKDGSLGPEFDHLTLQVQCPAEVGSVWLADVGFGDSFLEPLCFAERGEQRDGLRAYRIEHGGVTRWVWERDYDGTWARQYCFDLQPRQLSDFAEMCVWQQTSPESSFTQRRVCTRATPDGRITLSDMCLITTAHGRRDERLLDGEEEYRGILREKFGIVLDGHH